MPNVGPRGPGARAFAAAALAAAAALTPVTARPAAAQPIAPTRRVPREVAGTLFGGTSWSLPTPLTVRPRGAASTTLRARYATRPLRDAPYYAYRVDAGTVDRAGEAEVVHHKVYLENPAPPIEHFEVTHGYNLATAAARAPAGRYQVRLGLGLVIAHPEGRIAGRELAGQRTFLGGGYHIAGVTAQLGVGRRYLLGSGATAAFAAPELKLTASAARVPLGDADGGDVLVPNVALHALAGLGVRRAW